MILEALYLNYDYLVKPESSDDLRVKRRLIRDKMIVDAEKLHIWDEQDHQKSRNRVLAYDRIIKNESDLFDYDKIAEQIYNRVITKGTIKR